MKRFRFPLETVLRWRISQFDLEQAKLRPLIAELERLHREFLAIDDSEFLQRSSVQEPAATAAERSGLNSWLRWARDERQRLRAQIADCERRIAEQRQRVIEARRACELLEKLEARQLAGWQAEADREVEQLAADAYLAKWGRSPDLRRASTPGKMKR